VGRELNVYWAVSRQVVGVCVELVILNLTQRFLNRLKCATRLSVGDARKLHGSVGMLLCLHC